jgi:hypothetical protein
LDYLGKFRGIGVFAMYLGVSFENELNNLVNPNSKPFVFLKSFSKNA